MAMKQNIWQWKIKLMALHATILTTNSPRVIQEYGQLYDVRRTVLCLESQEDTAWYDYTFCSWSPELQFPAQMSFDGCNGSDEVPYSARMW